MRWNDKLTLICALKATCIHGSWEQKLPPNFWSLKGKNSVKSDLVINEQKYIICWLCSSRKEKMTAINIISVGVNCPELTPPKASWQTDGREETHSFHSLGWDIYSTGNQHGGNAVLSILIAVSGGKKQLTYCYLVRPQNWYYKFKVWLVFTLKNISLGTTQLISTFV